MILKELREQIVLPSTVDVSERASSDFVARLASRMAPGLEQSVGAVHWRVGEANGIDWTAEGTVEGVFVFVCLRPSAREVSLLVDPRFASPSSRTTTRTVWVLLGGLAAASVAIGAARRSFWWAFLPLVSTIAFWICVDMVREEMRVRRAIASLDRIAWRRRFEEAVALALNAG